MKKVYLAVSAALLAAALVMSFGKNARAQSSNANLYYSPNIQTAGVLLTASTTTLKTVAPSYVGQLVGAIDAAGRVFGVCYSSGSAAGAWVYVSTPTATASAPLVPCL